MRIFILEDNQERIKKFRRELIGHELVVVETALDAKTMLSTNSFDMIFLDHDLGGQEHVSTADTNTGSEVVRWMVEQIKRDGMIDLWSEAPVIIHSMNLPAALDMKHKLDDIGMEVYRVSFLDIARVFDSIHNVN